MLGSKEEIDFYERNGYFADNAGVTLEAAFQDWTVGQMALKMGKKADYSRFNRRASGWTSLYDPEIGLIMPRRSDGSTAIRSTAGDGSRQTHGRPPGRFRTTSTALPP